MVSADNLNLDCLELIFAFLPRNDLVSISLVSRSFLAGVIPRLYRTLSYGPKQAKRYHTIISPFAAVLAHPNLATHVRHIDLRDMPTVKFMPNPQFMDDCIRTINLCKNLGSFTCTRDVMPNFLLALQEKVSLEQLRFIASLTTDQATQLIKITGLRALTLDSGSWTVVDILPRWTQALRPTLTSLTLTSIQTLSQEIMETVLADLPLLNSLHVLNCPKVDQSAVLHLVTYTPQLQSLAFTSYPTARAIPIVISPLPLLRHLAIDTQCAPTPDNTTPTLWTTILNYTRMWSCPLKSLSLKLSEKITLGDHFVQSLVNGHKATLTHLALRNCTLSRESTMLVCRKCRELETLKLNVPVKELNWFQDALMQAKRIHTLTDIGDAHTKHPQRAPIQKNEIRSLLMAQPCLEKIVADGRTWTVSDRRGLTVAYRLTVCTVQAVRYPGKGDFELKVQKNGPTLRHWFIPRRVWCNVINPQEPVLEVTMLHIVPATLHTDVPDITAQFVVSARHRCTLHHKGSRRSGSSVHLYPHADIGRLGLGSSMV
ncbi:hypothetical protein C8Q80DRAFT_1095778 [Daedaleopsis nitida]|nr:hypothetical protein C8Q80DRAFT_1095778 [Daedaleopsis nitida]